jgi:hypothetical protein
MLASKPSRSTGENTALLAPWAQAFGAGLLIGLSGMCHQFGGVFWAVIVVALKLTRLPPHGKSREFLRWLALFGLGGLSAALIWLPQILASPEIWRSQFSYMLGLKAHLSRDFTRSAFRLLWLTLGKSPALPVVILAGLAMGYRGLQHPKIWKALGICLLLLFVWHCHSFEPYAMWYAIHFLAALCILFALAFDELTSWFARRLASPWAGRLQWGMASAVIALGLSMAYIPMVEVFELPYRATQQKIADLIASQVRPDDRVLAGPGYYFQVPGHHKSLWYWGDQLDLGDYNLVVAPYATPADVPGPAGNVLEQWVQVFTAEQAAVFHRDFELVASVPDQWVKPRWYPTGYQPGVPGCFIYRNKHPRKDA